MKSRHREIELWSCCGQRPILVTINADDLTGEAWRLARCLATTNRRRPDEGVRVQSFATNMELERASGYPNCRHLLKQGLSTAEVEAHFRQVWGDWVDNHQYIDWRFEGFHIWPDHRSGPHRDPDPEALRLKALAYIQAEATRITKGRGTTIARGDWSVRLLPEGYGEEIVILPDEQSEAEVARITRALFGGRG